MFLCLGWRGGVGRGQVPVVQDWHLFICSRCVLPVKHSLVSEPSEHCLWELQGGVHFTWVGGGSYLCYCNWNTVYVLSLWWILLLSHLAWAPHSVEVVLAGRERNTGSCDSSRRPPGGAAALTPRCLESPISSLVGFLLCSPKLIHISLRLMRANSSMVVLAGIMWTFWKQGLEQISANS